MARKRSHGPAKAKNNKKNKAHNENSPPSTIQSLDEQFQTMSRKYFPLQNISTNPLNPVQSTPQPCFDFLPKVTETKRNNETGGQAFCAGGSGHSGEQVLSSDGQKKESDQIVSEMFKQTKENTEIIDRSVRGCDWSSVPQSVDQILYGESQSEFPEFEPGPPLQQLLPSSLLQHPSMSVTTKRAKKKKTKVSGKAATENNENSHKVNGRLPILTKRQIIEECNKSEAEHGKAEFTKIANKYGVKRQSVWALHKNQDRILKHLVRNPYSKATVISAKRNPIIEIMEDTLIFWIDWMLSNRARLCKLLIKEKAREIVSNYEKQLGQEGTTKFEASNGWFYLFCKRTGLRSIKCTGESACVDLSVVNSFIEEMAKVIKEEGYHPKQVFNVDELGLFWKLISDITYAPGYTKFVPGSKKAKQRVTMMIGCNAFGDFPLKPILIGHSKRPRAFSHAGINSEDLPFIYRCNKKSAWMTTSLFREWFNDYFVPAVMDYLEKEGLPKKALLILDNAPVHPKDIAIDHPNVKVLYMPPNCSCLLQPMDQAAIKTFKSYYVRSTMKECNRALSEQHIIPEEFWRQFTILDCIKYANNAWQEVKPSTWRGSWKKVWPSIEEDCAMYEQADLSSDLETELNENMPDSLRNEAFYKLNLEMCTDEIDYEELTCEQIMHIKENVDLVAQVDGSLLEKITEIESQNNLDDSGEQFGMNIAMDDAQDCVQTVEEKDDENLGDSFESANCTAVEHGCGCRINCAQHSILLLSKEIHQKALQFQSKHKFDVTISIKCKK